MKSLRAFLLLIRIPNLLIIAATQALMLFMVLELPLASKYLYFIISTVLVAAGGNIINDYFDVRIDNINKPHEVWVGRQFDRRTVIIMHIIVNVLAFALAFLVSWRFLAITVLCSVILWAYSKWLKCIPLVGNVSVATLTGLVTLSIGVVFNIINLLILTYSLFAFAINLIREISKDLEDVKGDRMFECQTIATVIGVSNTKKLLLGMEVVFLLLISGTVLFAGGILKWYLLLALVIPTLFLIYQTTRAHTKNNFRNMSKTEKIIILLGVISLTLVNIPGT